MAELQDTSRVAEPPDLDRVTDSTREGAKRLKTIG
jgi:hypothetical protein